MDKRNETIVTEQQVEEKGFKPFSELVADVAKLPAEQQKAVALFATGVIASAGLAAGTAGAGND